MVRLTDQRIVEDEEAGGKKNFESVTVSIVVFESDKDGVPLINRDYVWIESILASVAGVLPRKKNYPSGWCLIHNGERANLLLQLTDLALKRVDLAALGGGGRYQRNSEARQRNDER